jgi:type I restriction enzyme, S subunit
MSAGLRAGYTQTEVGVIPGEWEVKRLGDVSPLQRGFDLLTTRLRQGCYPVVYSNGVSSYHNEFMVKGPGVATGRSGTIGNVHFVEEDFWPHNTSLWVTSFKGNSPKFIFYLLCSLGLERFGTGSGVPTLNRNDVHAHRVQIPQTLAEQTAIATALSDVDALLAKLDAFIAKKRDLKQAATQQLLTGQTRLPGFSGEWEVKRLGDVGDCLRGVTYKGDSDLWPHDTACTKRLLRSNNVQSSTVVIEDIQFVNSDRVSAHQLLRANDILICMANGSKALVGKAGLFSVSDGYDYTFGAFMGCFRSNTAASSSSFVFYLFQTGRYRNYINNLLAGSSINNLSPGSIESLEFHIPSMAEQTAIATILSDMDTELAALETRRDKTLALKQGMMQELLTGRIRLI